MTMRPIDQVMTYLAAGQPVMIWGAPGTGKTASVAQHATDRRAHLETLVLATREPTEVGGWLALDAQGVVQQSPPPWARRLRAALDAGREAWLFLDELSCAPPATQAAALSLIPIYRDQPMLVAGLSLSGVRVLAAGNPPESAADVGWLSPPMAGRFAHVEWAVDVGAWVAGEASGWGRPRSAAHAAAAASVTAYLARHREALAPALQGTQAAQGRAWPSPRTWSAGIASMALVQAADACAILGGCVGVAAATEWATWAEALDLPEPAELLAGRAALPARADQVYAALQSAASYALADHAGRECDIAAAWRLVASVRPDVALGAAQVLLAGTGGEVPDECVELGRRIMAARAGVAEAAPKREKKS